MSLDIAFCPCSDWYFYFTSSLFTSYLPNISSLEIPFLFPSCFNLY